MYEEITDILFREAEEKDIVYAVPGHPFVAEKTVQLLVSQQKKRGVEVYVAGGQSFWMRRLIPYRLTQSKGCNSLTQGI